MITALIGAIFLGIVACLAILCQPKYYMTHSIYEELTALHDADDYQIRKTLELMGIWHIFDYAWHKYQEAGNFKCIVMYFCYVYSWESKAYRIGEDWQKAKMRIAARVNLPEYLRDDVVNMKDQFLSDSFQEFLNLYQDNMDYVHVTSLKDMYAQIMLQSTRFVADGEGNVDLPTKMKNLKNATELKEEIQELDLKMLEEYRKLNAPKRDFDRDRTDIVDGSNPLRHENAKHIRG